MDTNVKSVVSMLARDEKITLFTETGEIIEITKDGPYDIAKLSEYLTEHLTGLASFEVNLDDFEKRTRLRVEDLSSEGIEITYVVNGKTVQGIFYPEKTSVEVSVDTMDEKVVIPNVENLQAHIARAREDGSPSVANFFKRIAPVIQSRRHSGEDLMKFIKKSEMPLTNDGRIIAYKRVKKISEDDYFADCHTGVIKQRVGSRVTMPVELVDPDRHQSCSVGLHVANLGYLRGFDGSHTLIVLVNPENFIAVPHGDDTKARVCSYDIIGVMSAHSHEIVNTGKHVEGDDTLEKLISSAVEGRSVQPFEEIFVGNRCITKVEPLTNGTQQEPPAPVSAKATGKSLKETVQEEEPTEEAKVIDLARKTREARNAQSMTGTMGLPKEIYDVFVRLYGGESKTSIAESLNTSTRSIGRWMEKHDYANFEQKMMRVASEAVEISPEDLEAAADFHDEVVANGGTNEGMGDFSDQPTFSVFIENHGPRLISLVKVIRTVYRVGLPEAVRRAKGIEAVATNLSRVAKDKIVSAIAEVGATVRVVSSDDPKPEPVKEKKASEPAKPKAPSLAEQAREMFNKGEHLKLMRFKKTKKKSWETLGFTPEEVSKIIG